MDIYSHCKKCGTTKIIGQKCDTCGESTQTKWYGVPIKLEFTYGSSLDGETYHFCSLKCLKDFVLNEIKKENPETRFELGKGGKK
jgi:YHS domain-containing protein